MWSILLRGILTEHRTEVKHRAQAEAGRRRVRLCPVDLSSFPPGAYWLEVRTDKGVSRTKLVRP